MGKMGGTASQEIEAAIDDVWAVIADVLSAPDWQGGLISMEALETDSEGRATLVETKNDIKVKTTTTEVRFTYEAPTRLSFEQEQGDLKSVEGAWILEDLGGGRTKATYTLDSDPGRVISMLLRGPIETKVREMLVDSRPKELKERIEGS